MARKPSPDNPTCPHCGAAHVVRNGSKDGRPRWVCRQCRRSFGPTYGTPMYRLRTPPAEVGRTLLIVMRRGSLSAAEEISGHKYETIGRWLRAAAQHAQAITEVLVRDLHLTEVEVDAFWSFVNWTLAFSVEKPFNKVICLGQQGAKVLSDAWEMCRHRP